MKRILTTMAPVWLLVAASCQTKAPLALTDDQRMMLQVLSPARVEVVDPFTKVASFDGDQTPDGIELFLRAVNSLGNPGLMIVGDVFVELYEYVPASADNKGRRVETWPVKLATTADQRNYWNPLTQMYEFRLAIDRENLPKSERCVLVTTYNSPFGEHLVDEAIIVGPNRK